METEKDKNQTLIEKLRGKEMRHQGEHTTEVKDFLPTNQIPIPTQNNNTPIIRTFENDVLNAVKDDNISKISTLSRQLDSVNDNDVYNTANQIDKNKKITLIVLVVLFFMLIVGAGATAYYFKIYKKPAPVIVVIQDKKYYVKDVWTKAPATFIENTDTATSTTSSVLINVKDFDSLYFYSLNNEDIFKGLAKERFEYNNLDTFVDVSFENRNMRIADAQSGAFVYGFVGKKYFLATNSLNEWIKISSELK